MSRTYREHFEEAERLAANAKRHLTEEAGDMRVAEVVAAIGQVHAQLAATAAIAAVLRRYMPDHPSVEDGNP